MLIWRTYLCLRDMWFKLGMESEAEILYFGLFEKLIADKACEDRSRIKSQIGCFSSYRPRVYIPCLEKCLLSEARKTEPVSVTEVIL